MDLITLVMEVDMQGSNILIQVIIKVVIQWAQLHHIQILLVILEDLVQFLTQAIHL